jgi:hypothetical protein
LPSLRPQSSRPGRRRTPSRSSSRFGGKAAKSTLESSPTSPIPAAMSPVSTCLAQSWTQNECSHCCKWCPKSATRAFSIPGSFSPTEVRNVAQAPGIQLHVSAVGSGREGYERAFQSMADADVDALLVPAFPRFVKEAPQIIELAAQRRIPPVYEWSPIAVGGVGWPMGQHPLSWRGGLPPSWTVS